jgi:hypothetical protein
MVSNCFPTSQRLDIDHLQMIPSDRFVGKLENGKEIVVQPRQFLGAGAEGTVQLYEIFYFIPF